MNLFPQDDVISPSSTSEEEDSEKKQQKKLKRQKRIRRTISRFFKLKIEKDKKDKDKEEPESPQRPNTLPVDKKPEPVPTIVTPSKFHRYTLNLHAVFDSDNVCCFSVWVMGNCKSALSLIV